MSRQGIQFRQTTLDPSHADTCNNHGYLDHNDNDNVCADDKHHVHDYVPNNNRANVPGMHKSELPQRARSDCR